MKFYWPDDSKGSCGNSGSATGMATVSRLKRREISRHLLRPLFDVEARAASGMQRGAHAVVETLRHISKKRAGA